MPRELAPCGTFTAYKRHLRRKEPVDTACAQACRDQGNERDGARVDRKIAALPDLPSPDDSELSPVEDAKDNLRIVKAALQEAVPREVPALSKRRQELVALIQELDGKKEVSLGDELAAIRARRSGA